VTAGGERPLGDLARTGDEAAFEALISPLVEPALRLAHSMLGDRWEAEDATQEAITRAWRKLAQLRAGMPVRPWFLAIVINQCRNVRRTRWFTTARIAEVFQGARQDHTEVERVDVARALARLPNKDRQALFLHFYLDLPVEEVGFKGFAGTWADDGLHFCLMVPIDFLGASGVQGTLQLITPGSAPKVIAKVGRVYEQATLLVAGCSVRHDRAIVVQTYGDSPGAAQYWVIQLSTGKVLWTHQFDISNPVIVVASPQAQYIAESQVAVGGTTTIFGVDGTHVATLPDVVDGFSWDGSLVVTGTLPARMRAVLWRTGKVIWTAPGGYLVVRVDPQPDGTSLAVWITSLVGQTVGPTLSNLYVIASDGAVVADIKYPPA
jgi:RNA polymerase sigma-70 factor, ECF subfamily